VHADQQVFVSPGTQPLRYPDMKYRATGMSHREQLIVLYA